MWVLISAALLLSPTERATCDTPPTASPWTITVSPAEITAEKGLCAVISCTFTHPDNIKPTAAVWFKCPTKGKCDEDKIRIFHLKEPSKAHDGYEQRVSLLETDLTKKNCSVIINDIRENDAGEYQFRLPNSNTYPKKVKITVSALTQKPSVLTPPLTEGEPATLTCTAPGMCSGTPPNITWTWRGTGDNITELRDNITIQEREDLTTVTTTHFSTLTFTPSAEHHNMMVTCQVTFQKKYQIEETVTLNVTYVKDPQITGNEMVKEDGTLDLTCSVDSYPPSDITWSKNGTSTPLQNYTENATLTISNVTRQHAGDYVCTVQHLNRTMTASTVVTVMYLPVILPGSGCVDQAEVMTCLCVSQGVPSPLIVWPLLELNTERCSPTTSVLGSSVNSTISLPVGNHNNTTVECVSRNVVGVVREKLQVTQNKSQEKQREKELEGIIALLSDLKLITAFVVGAALSATICCIFLCLKGKCKRQKERIPMYSDSKSPFMNLEMVTCEDQQMDAGQAVGGEQTPLQLELSEGAENGGPQTSGAAGKFATGEELNEVDYARINYSLLKKKTPEEAEKKTTTTESDYAKIKREKKKEGDEDGREGSGVNMGKDEEKENSKPAAESDLWTQTRGPEKEVKDRMWVLILAALLFSLTERATCRKLAAPPTASSWTITVSPAEITAEKGLCAVISCTFTHPDNIKPTAAVWFKCPTKGKCDEDKIRIVHSNKPSKAQEGYKQRVSLLETDLTKKNCSVIINDIRENDAGEYQFRLPSSYTYPKKVKITVSALTQKPSVLTPPLTEGEPATLTCTAPGMCSGTPPNITWTWRGTGDNITELRDNITIQEREDLTNVTTTHFSMLTFTPTAKHHGTNVTCLVSFNGRITTKKTLTMNVAHVKEPKISGCNTVREGDTLNLTCSDDSYPPSSSNITWSKKGTTALERNNSGRATLIISNMTREHAGEYVCTAQHHSRSLMASTVVTVMLNSTISLPVRNHTNTTMECVSRNEAGRVREVQVTQIEKQEEDVSKDIMALLSDLQLITAFVVGAALSASIFCIFLCLKGKRKRRKERIPKDSDSKSHFMNLEMVACEDQQMDAGQAVGGKQTPLQVELKEGEENGGPQTSGAIGKSTTGGEPNEVDYASINYSLLKKKTPEEAEKKTTTTETDYAEIKRQKKNEEEEDGGEGSGVMEEVEWEEGDEMVGKEEEKENGKPLRETDEDTALYSNIKTIMGGE
ncbi:uncharacterized protein LOC112223834 isoform X2 [Oncorhynchus tshawytscha]|uniref:uncharacterized protein LOC112223834 isoform X2 n=1 Tax=Oncorhynchus tshawytscha TaxID=74940 RepID=UPI001C3DB390|nr:uncharacterized protein LOC112223834 isoform X2 [Oncorhynchus tshawytscha]